MTWDSSGCGAAVLPIRLAIQTRFWMFRTWLITIVLRSVHCKFLKYSFAFSNVRIAVEAQRQDFLSVLSAAAITATC
jgi:hypothetical protein